VVKIVTVYVDKRELRSPVVKELEKLGVTVEYRILDVADYILSDRVAVERKTPEDFFNSLFHDRKLFGQLHDVALSYDVPLLFFEGYEGEMYSTRNVNPKAIDGILNAIALMRIPIRYTLNPAGTAQAIAAMASKEQNESKRSISAHGKRSHLSPNGQLVYTVSSLTGCNIGEDTAKLLLEAFGSIERIATAGIGELDDVPGIGLKTAEAIREIITRKYEVKP